MIDTPAGWPFSESPDTIVTADVDVLAGAPVFRVRRTPDGNWRVGCLADATQKTVRTSLGVVWSLHPLIGTLADLPPGHQAWNPTEDGSWMQGEIPTGPTYFIQFEATPRRDNDSFIDIAGAYVNCWVRASTLEAAQTIALEAVADDGWIAGSVEDAYEIERENCVDEEALEYFDQVQDDGVVFVFHTYPIDEEEDLED